MSVMLISGVQDDELHRACDVGNLLLVQCLVKQGANVNSKSVLVSDYVYNLFCVPVSIHNYTIEELDLR